MKAVDYGDSEYLRIRDRLGLKTTPAQDRACLLLEGEGQIFLVDYGYENAIAKASHIEKELMRRAYGDSR
jgi:hypothetical protein